MTSRNGSTNDSEIESPTHEPASERRNARTRAEYATLVNRALRKSVEGILEAGSWLIEARQALRHGEFEAMVKEDLQRSPSEARKYMRIAKNSALTNRSHMNALPSCYTTLYCLSQIRAARLSALIENGTVHAKMQVREAEALAGEEALERRYHPRPRRATPGNADDVPSPEDAAPDEDAARDEDEDAEPGEDAERDEDKGDTADEVEPRPDESREQDEAERTNTWAVDIAEALADVLHRNRRLIEHVRLHGDPTTRAALADQMREHATAVNRLADELAPTPPAEQINCHVSDLWDLLQHEPNWSDLSQRKKAALRKAIELLREVRDKLRSVTGTRPSLAEAQPATATSDGSSE
jgi:hypothetical protein